MGHYRQNMCETTETSLRQQLTKRTSSAYCSSSVKRLPNSKATLPSDWKKICDCHHIAIITKSLCLTGHVIKDLTRPPVQVKCDQSSHKISQSVYLRLSGIRQCKNSEYQVDAGQAG